MTARVVRATELERMLKVLDARGVRPATVDLLPGGVLRLHLTTPPDAPDPGREAREAAAWEERLR